MNIRVFFLFFAVIYQLPIFAQEDIKESEIRIPMINFNIGFHISGGDLADRFGSSTLFGIGFQIKNNKNFYWGFDAAALAGSDVKEDDIIDIITADATDIIDVNGNTATIRFWQRGAHSQFILGKIIPVVGPNKNSGLFIQIGSGFMYHKIRIEDIGNNAPQLSANMLKGYDRLCMGLTSSQLFGYRHFSNNNKINFFVGIEFIQAFTKDVRRYDYNAQMAYNDKRIDLLSGLKFGWTIPLYKKSNNQYYYY